MKKLIPVTMSLLLALSASAADEMRRLDFLVGDWKGEASVQMGPGKPQYVMQVEQVRQQLGGKVLIINGVGRSKLADGAAGEVVHEALAVISFDEKTKKYRFDAWSARDGYVEAWMEPGDRSARWGFDTPQGGKIRYTISLDDKGEWRETGEFSRDGRTWMPAFFDMTLVKK